jgi:hypothetical protein
VSDREALDRAYDLARKYPVRAEQLATMVRYDGLEYAKRFAAYDVQTTSLGLKPWESPPCHGDPDGNGTEDKLLRRMLAAGLSKWEPDPLGALTKVRG